MDEHSDSKWLDLSLALLFLVPAGLVFQQSATSLTEQGVASGDVMNNAAMFPRLLAAILAALAVLQVTMALRKPPAATTGRWSTPIRNSLLVMVLLATYPFLLPLTGYHIATPLLCLSSLMLFGLHPALAAGTGLAMSLAVALFFESALNVVLPVGIFGLALPF